mmetsp:Transcript_57534/g.186937  ORF Transcript_57534/g.186937 Transcript_57534/m.186937 type:complete len:339 (-) Transcript_57534:2597-3613(-)
MPRLCGSRHCLHRGPNPVNDWSGHEHLPVHVAFFQHLLGHAFQHHPPQCAALHLSRQSLRRRTDRLHPRLAFLRLGSLCVQAPRRRKTEALGHPPGVGQRGVAGRPLRQTLRLGAGARGAHHEDSRPGIAHSFLDPCVLRASAGCSGVPASGRNGCHLPHACWPRKNPRCRNRSHDHRLLRAALVGLLAAAQLQDAAGADECRDHEDLETSSATPGLRAEGRASAGRLARHPPCRRQLPLAGRVSGGAARRRRRRQHPRRRAARRAPGALGVRWPRRARGGGRQCGLWKIDARCRRVRLCAARLRRVLDGGTGRVRSTAAPDLECLGPGECALRAALR